MADLECAEEGCGSAAVRSVCEFHYRHRPGEKVLYTVPFSDEFRRELVALATALGNGLAAVSENE